MMSMAELIEKRRRLRIRLLELRKTIETTPTNPSGFYVRGLSSCEYREIERVLAGEIRKIDPDA